MVYFEWHARRQPSGTVALQEGCKMQYLGVFRSCWGLSLARVRTSVFAGILMLFFFFFFKSGPWQIYWSAGYRWRTCFILKTVLVENECLVILWKQLWWLVCKLSAVWFWGRSNLRAFHLTCCLLRAVSYSHPSLILAAFACLPKKLACKLERSFLDLCDTCYAC